ncbi:Coproporphyrinogen III oxidase [Candidatus Protochlamydia naegleriophila]|uniref:Heme chaperone HemW n=1 Tax=Candidatus Protochlamydia naegleriophila TaxID=389348 RepID=A0A0U5J9D2_9BACT|nr:radical SAM family heme chaperone HemW [Candidatus Protochlamydia naegleriophila]CUI16408.1 Coproporphyrinogen III oxidase [Candidatus Protochlamydia naegleriophila]
MLTIGNPSSKEASLYFHIPFCTRKCEYCHFYVLPDQEPLKNQLLEGFKLEWERMLPFLQDKSIATIYFGGGTPSLFGPDRIRSILEMIHHSLPFDFSQTEITLEVNPENAQPALMQAYAQAGINRASLGIQTLDPDLLTLLGRLHSPSLAIKAVQDTYQAGISNISVDLMYDLPKQSLHHWEMTLEYIRSLPLSHLSLYNLTIEPHTIFFKKQAELTPLLPNEEASLAMYNSAIERLTNFGLEQYEISAFAKPGFYSRHNTGYWTARPFLGFGPSAFSYWQGKRFRNIAHLGKYYRALKSGHSPIDFEEQLDAEAHLKELFVIQIRLCQGILQSEFERRHGALSQETLQTLEYLLQEGFFSHSKGCWKLTKKGILFYDTVATELI